MAPPPEPNPAAGEGAVAGLRSSGRDSTWREQPAWPFWLPVGLSTLLLVLFAVVVNRQQAEAERIGELMARVQSLEQSRTLERTAVLEQQLRAMLSRMQTMEKGGLALISKEREQQQVIERLQSELEQVRSTLLITQRGSAADGLPLPSPATSVGRRPAQSRPASP